MVRTDTSSLLNTLNTLNALNILNTLNIQPEGELVFGGVDVLGGADGGGELERRIDVDFGSRREALPADFIEGNRGRLESERESREESKE